MNPAAEQELAHIRDLFQSAPIPWNTRLMVILMSLTLLVVVLALVKRRSLREEYTPIWLFAAFGIAVLSVWQQALFELTRAIGAWTHASTLFFFGLLFLGAICLNYAVRLSRLTLQVKLLTQELALLRNHMEREQDPPARLD